MLIAGTVHIFDMHNEAKRQGEAGSEHWLYCKGMHCRAYKMRKGTPSGIDNLQYCVGSRRLHFDLHSQNAKQNDLYGCSSSIPAQVPRPRSGL